MANLPEKDALPSGAHQTVAYSPPLSDLVRQLRRKNIDETTLTAEILPRLQPQVRFHSVQFDSLKLLQNHAKRRHSNDLAVKTLIKLSHLRGTRGHRMFNWSIRGQPQRMPRPFLLRQLQQP